MAVSSADKKKLGKWIKQAREKKQPHLSQRQLALAVDITNASLSSIESGMIFPSEELLLKLIEQLQPPPELREKMLALFAKAKGTSPPDINAELSKNPKLWGLIRQLIFINASALSRKDYIVLYLFFSSSFAYKQMVRSSSMTAQPHLTITLIRDLLVCNCFYGCWFTWKG